MTETSASIKDNTHAVLYDVKVNTDGVIEISPLTDVVDDWTDASYETTTWTDESY